MTKIACLLLRIYVRRENTQTGIQLCFNLVFTTASQKSNLNRKIYVFRLFPTEWMFPRLALTLCQAKIVLCFLHEWGLHPSYATENGGNVGGKYGGKYGGDVPSLSPALFMRCSNMIYADSNLRCLSSSTNRSTSEILVSLSAIDKHDFGVRRQPPSFSFLVIIVLFSVRRSTL